MPNKFFVLQRNASVQTDKKKAGEYRDALLQFPGKCSKLLDVVSQ